MNLRQAAKMALDVLERLYDNGEVNVSRSFHEEVMDELAKALAEPQTTHWEGCEEVHPECKEKST